MSKDLGGFDDLLKLDIDTETESHRIIEGEISENVSLLYDATTNEYFIESDVIGEQEYYDGNTVCIDPHTFTGFELGNCKLSKEDFDGFVKFIQTLIEKGEI